MIITTMFCLLASLFLVFFEKYWNERCLRVNVVYILGTVFFTSYSFMAFGLCFVSIDVFLLNFPSILCAILSIYSLVKLMSFKKYGYKLLWVCTALFSIGSYWWLVKSLWAPFLLATIAILCMSFLTSLLKDKRDKEFCMWDRLQ